MKILYNDETLVIQDNNSIGNSQSIVTIFNRNDVTNIIHTPGIRPTIQSKTVSVEFLPDGNVKISVDGKLLTQ